MSNNNRILLQKEDTNENIIKFKKHDSRVIIDFTNRSQELSNVISRLSSGAIIKPHEMSDFTLELGNYHAAPVYKLARYFQTDLDKGLNSSSAERALIENGLNRLPPTRDYPMIVKFLLCFTVGFSPLLWIAFIIALITYKPLGTPPTDVYNLSLALAILLVIIISSLFVFSQEIQSTKILANFKIYVPLVCLVLRDGVSKSINPINLVVGDIVVLENGSKVPADMRIITCSGLKIDKSMLTGENEPVKLISEPVDTNIPMLESKNIAFMGCNVVEGEGVGLVIASGLQNQLSKIISQVHVVKSKTTSLQGDINRFISMIGTFAITTVTVVVLVWVFYLRVKHNGFMSTSSMLVNAIAVLVAYIPEGLPLSLSTGLNIIATRLLLDHSVLIKQLSVIETVGSMTLLATDKTGTLTKNKMTVTKIITNNVILEPDQIFNNSDYSQYCLDLMTVCVLCNQSKLQIIENNNGIRKEAVGSNGIDKALMNFAEKYKYVDELLGNYHIDLLIPFSSKTKTTTVIVSNRTSIEQSFIILIKGAPEYILECCSTIHDEIDNKEKDLTHEMSENILNFVSSANCNGERVIAMACLTLFSTDYLDPNYKFKNEPSPNFPTKNMKFLSCIAVSDPPRSGVKETVHTLRLAGIKIAMVTGDSSGTALAIAKAVGIIDDDNNSLKTDSLYDFNQFEQCNHSSEGIDEEECKSAPASEITPKTDAIVINGRDLQTISPSGWDFVFAHSQYVFARTTPQQKLEIVKESQKRGHRVAVTGDGVNDSPALKRADVGIAMGMLGSAVARDAAGVVLLDDNFLSIKNAVEEGRLIFSNLRKVIAYQLSAGSWAELIPVLATFFLGMPQPLSSFLMIIISCMTDVFNGIAIINEPPEKEILLEQPRNLKTSNLVDFKLFAYSYFFYGTIESIGAFLNYFLYMAERGNTRAVPNPIPVDDDGTRQFPAGYRAKQLLGAWNWGLNIEDLGKDEVAAANVASSVYFVTLVVCQMGHLLTVRIKTPYFSEAVTGVREYRMMTLWNELLKYRPIPRLLLAWFGSIVTIIFFTEVPVMQRYTGTGHVPGRYWGIAIGWSILCFTLNEIRKWLVILFPNSFIAIVAW